MNTLDQEECSLQFTPGQPLRGCLRRQGGVMRGWHRKFFVLDGGCLFCFNREDDISISSTYQLDHYQLRDVPANPDEPDKFAFELVKEKSSGDSMILCAANETEKKEWMRALCYHIYAGKGGAIFGLSLKEAMKYEHRRGRSVPYIVELCVTHLENNDALNTQGIFRLAGKAGLMRELRAQFEMGQRPNLDDVDVHTVGSLLKAYLRELPQSLVTPDLYQRAMNCALRYSDTRNEDKRQEEVQTLAALMEELPDINYTVLAYICRFLHRLAANAGVNKMTAENLALVFGPNLIRHLDTSAEMFMVTADLTQQLALLLIRHTPQVLPHRPQRESVPAIPSAAHFSLMDSLDSVDLLRMSRPLDPLDPCLLPPEGGASKGRRKLDLKLGAQRSSSEGQSPISPNSPMVFVTDHFAASDARAQKREGGDRGDEAGKSDTKIPVAFPRRTKSSRRSNRRSAGTPTSPNSPDSPRHLCTQDVLTALATASATQAQSPGPEVSRSQSMRQPASHGKLGEGHKREHAGGEKRSESPSQQRTMFDPANRRSARYMSSTFYLPNFCNGKSGSAENTLMSSADPLQRQMADSSGRVRPSTSVLEAQVSGLKAELAGMKAKSSTVEALKNQLDDMAAKYEARIQSLKDQQQREIMALKARVNAERSARTEALEKAQSLQDQLSRYKQHFGDLRI